MAVRQGDRAAFGNEPGHSRFTALRELEDRTASAAPALDELHRNSRILFCRDRSAPDRGVFQLRPRHPEEA